MQGVSVSEKVMKSMKLNGTVKSSNKIFRDDVYCPYYGKNSVEPNAFNNTLLIQFEIII